MTYTLKNTFLLVFRALDVGVYAIQHVATAHDNDVLVALSFDLWCDFGMYCKCLQSYRPILIWALLPDMNNILLLLFKMLMQVRDNGANVHHATVVSSLYLRIWPFESTFSSNQWGHSMLIFIQDSLPIILPTHFRLSRAKRRVVPIMCILWGCFDSEGILHPRECLASNRERWLLRVERWARDESGWKIFWLEFVPFTIYKHTTASCSPINKKITEIHILCVFSN